MFWISYSITLVLAWAIAMALMTIRMVLSAVGRIDFWRQGLFTASRRDCDNSRRTTQCLRMGRKCSSRILD